MTRRVALIVGVKDYKPSTGLDSLSAPVKDAQAIYEILHDYGDFQTITPFPKAPSESRTHNAQVGEHGYVEMEGLLNEIIKILDVQGSDEIELAVIYFSGHAVNDLGKGVFLSASDNRHAVSLSWLANEIKKSGVNNICLWLDCCHSGGVFDFLDLSDKGFCVVAAAHAKGIALSSPDGLSLLTNLLCESLTPGGDNNQEIQTLEFIQYVKKAGQLYHKMF